MQLFKIIKFLLIFILLSVKSVHANPNVTIEEIFKTYESNVARFDLKYKGKSIEILATMKRVISLDESLNYKESSRKRWGYLSEFIFNQRKIICFTDDAESAAYSTPNEISYVTGYLADIDDKKMIITYCSARDPKNAATTFSISTAKEALEKAMQCDKYFEPSEIWEKLIEENYIVASMNDIYWLDDWGKEYEEYMQNEKKGIKNKRNYYDSDYPKEIKIIKNLEFYGLEIDYIYGFDIKRNPNQSTANAGPHTNITLLFKKNINLKTASTLLENKLNLIKRKDFYVNNNSLKNGLLMDIRKNEDNYNLKSIGSRVYLTCTFYKMLNKHEIKLY